MAEPSVLPMFFGTRALVMSGPGTKMATVLFLGLFVSGEIHAHDFPLIFGFII